MEYRVPLWFIVLTLALICFFVTSAAVRCRHLVSNAALVHLRRFLAITRLFFTTIISEFSSTSSHRLLLIYLSSLFLLFQLLLFLLAFVGFCILSAWPYHQSWRDFINYSFLTKVFSVKWLTTRRAADHHQGQIF